MKVTNWMHDCVKKTRYPGIWKTTNGYRVRVRAKNPRTGMQEERNQTFSNISIEEALIKQQRLRAEIRGGGNVERVRVRYGDFVESLFQRKIANGELSTEKSQRTWSDAQELHLLPHFNEWFIEEIRRRDIEEWKAKQGEQVLRGRLSPNTANGWIRVLLATLRSAVTELELETDPTTGVKPIETSTWTTYTEEEPNALTVAEVQDFMTHARVLYPQHYAQFFLGIATGRRPCELRPLRRNGPSPDIRWEESLLLVRRSQVIGEPVERTKSDVRLKVQLPRTLMEVLRDHVHQLPPGPMRECELLFPSIVGSFQSPNVLAKPIKAIAKAAKIEKHLSPYFMRRTFKDLCRAAAVHDFVSMAISGHTTIEMHGLYSTVSAPEVADSLAKVVDLMQFKRAKEQRDADESGDVGGDAEVVAS